MTQSIICELFLLHLLSFEKE